MSRKEEMKNAAQSASNVLKILSHPMRLMLVCSILEGEKSVSMLIEELGIRQSSVSQHLAKLRDAELVKTRKSGQLVYYSIQDPKVQALIQTLYEQYCPA